MNLPPLPGRRPMQGRDIHESHRVATPLELLFDLCFVVAIAAAASQLHHAVGAHHLGTGLVSFALAFFAIWWAWMNFTWFASAYDIDDTGYRLLTMVQIVGVLVLAAGIPRLTQGDLSTVTYGYAVMRLGLVSLWLRAAREHPERRRSCLRYAWSVLGAQALWLARLALPGEWLVPSFLLLALVELTIPPWAESAGGTPWHAHHIAERYSLFTIIVLGECVLGATNAVAGVIESHGWSLELALVGLGSAGLVLALWWVYFLLPSAQALHHHRERAFGWGYGHVPVFAALAALGAFLEVVADQLKQLPGVPAAAGTHVVAPALAMALVAGAVAVYLLAVWWLNAQLTRHQARLWPLWLGAVALLAATVAAVAFGLPLAWSLLLVPLAPAFVVISVTRGARRAPERFDVR